MENMLQLLAYTAQILGGISISVAALTYLVHRNQLNFDVITTCTERFQRIMTRMESHNKGERDKAKKEYVDLCNEQLFYFRRKYLPDEVVEEWLDGMIDYIPQLNTSCDIHPESPARKIEPHLLKEYPRVRKAFTVVEPYELDRNDEADERQVFIKHIRKQTRPRSRLSKLIRSVGSFLKGIGQVL